LFIRSGVALAAMIAAGTGAFDLTALKGSVLTFMTFGQYIIPLAVLELYFWTQRRGGRAATLAMAAGLVAISLTMTAGVAAGSIAIFVPAIRTAFDGRPSISSALAETIKTQGVDAAIKQYHALRAVPKPVYNFDEDELNSLGYGLISEKNYSAAIRILSLNTQIYPKSGNTWDSLGEAYMDNGDIADAVANYHKSLLINPRNQNARDMLAKMGAT
jgi:tetratricopeptide (TPR) repeat protein